jgi:hypothetical protein
MSQEITYRDVITKDYPTPDVFTGSSKEGIDISEIRLLFPTKGPGFYRSLLPSFEIDLSSVYSKLKCKTETYVTELLSEEDIISAMLTQDFIVKMPPVEEYTIWVKVKSVEKATPRIVEPEEF